MTFYPEFWIIFTFAALLCAVGFYKYIWFISVGYGLSISAIGACMLAVYFSELDVFGFIACILFFAYGIRLSGYLIYRELRSSAYSKKMKGEISDGSHMTLPLKIVLWLSCVLLYLAMSAPVIYRFANGQSSDICFVIGLIIMLGGIVFETVSDKQKSLSKKLDPNRFCDRGLFRIVRCPNYLGELMIWTGVFISGFTALQSVGQWIVSIIGYLGIVYIMFSGARRLELRQDRTYGGDPEYRAYVASTPILLPFVPLYSVKRHKWLVG